MKLENEERVNASKYRKKAVVDVGDTVLMRNHRKRIKFDPQFSPEPFIVVHVDEKSGEVLLKDNDDHTFYRRHLDDIKPWFAEVKQPITGEQDTLVDYARPDIMPEPITEDEDGLSESLFQPYHNAPNTTDANNEMCRRSERVRYADYFCIVPCSETG